MALAYRKENALNAICPYFTMFPLEYPNKIIKKYKKQRPVVLDPFCGRGTTLFSARTFGVSAWGIDSSPVAVAVARAKLASCDPMSPIELAENILSKVDPNKIPNTPFFRVAYHSDTLRDICALREGLSKLPLDTASSVILRAAILGALHGPLARNIDNMSYFSNQMPRTYASKPDYAVRFWSERGMSPPKVDVLRVLRRKIERLVGLSSGIPDTFKQVIQGDSRSADVFQSLNMRPSLIITSPPYYGMKTYVQDQWLRNWFLGGPESVDYSSGSQLDHSGKDTFSKSLGEVWRNIAKCASESNDLHMYVRFGIIPSASVNAKEIFRNSLEESNILWRLISVRAADSAEAGKRQAHQMRTGSSAAIEYDFHVERI